MKKILLTFVLLFTFLNTAFGNVNLELNISKNEINLDEEFQLTLDVNYDGDFSGSEVRILGLDKFHKTSQYNSSNYQNINGKITRNQRFTFSFYPNKTGEFNIGPAIINSGSGEIKSDTIKIKVLKPNLKEEIKGKIDNYSFFDKINYLGFLFGLVIILFFYFLYFFNKKTENKNEVKIEKKEKPKKINFKLRLKNLENKIDDLEKNKFYYEFNKIFKLYFLNEKNIDLSSLDLKEIKEKNIEKTFIEIYEKSYFSEFNNKRDTKQTRKKLIDEFLKLI